MEQEVPEVERRANDDVAVIALPGDQTSAIAPVEQAIAVTLDDTIELSRQPAEVGQLHQTMVACPTMFVLARPV